MTDWANITEAQTDPGAPGTSELWKAWTDRPVAIAEGANSAPVARTGWHPYDLTAVGGSEDGLIYDFAVDGGVATFDTPTFSDGYEYMLVFEGVGIQTAPSTTWTFQAQNADDDTRTTFFSGTRSTGSGNVGMMIHLRFPRVVGAPKLAQVLVPDVFADAADAVYQISFAPKVKSLRAAFSANLTAGKIRLLRRREYVSA
ncbi:hypothetical protein [Oceaniglobus trochenteri]|uniref:hypothetical protein n=1 Tax=Oceaniglobus trochenteri TaxID=2763260 RepID=UPI001CFFDD3E|nr:hypothetical protein [Oceaniglobus trochenteri]